MAPGPGGRKHGGKRPATPPAEPPRRPGLPDPESVVSERALVSPAGRKYRVLRTDETDPYDEPPKPPRRRR